MSSRPPRPLVLELLMGGGHHAAVLVDEAVILMLGLAWGCAYRGHACHSQAVRAAAALPGGAAHT